MNNKIQKSIQVVELNNEYQLLKLKSEEFVSRLNIKPEQLQNKNRLTLQFEDSSSNGTSHAYFVKIPDNKAPELSKLIDGFYKKILIEIQEEIDSINFE